MLTLYFCFAILNSATQQTAPASFWELQHAQLFENIQARKWYSAKRNLAFLKWAEPERYHQSNFVLTEAWIAEQEGVWQKVLKDYKSWGEDATWALIPKLKSQVHLGNYAQAIAFYEKEKKRFPKNARWQALRFYAQALMKSEAYDQALAVYKRIRQAKAPRSLRMEALYFSAAIYYTQGKQVQGRGLVEKLHESWPGSDESLDAIHLQERSETPAYLNQFKVWDRFSWVAYSNRDFDRAGYYFEKIKANGPSVYERDRARYFLALIPLKLGEPKQGLTAFETFLDQQEGGRFTGLGAYQYARSLLMNHQDEEVIAFCRDLWEREAKPPKWLQDCTKFLILGWRRTKDYRSFQKLEHALDQKAAGGNLRRFYHRNGVIWALQLGLPHDANHHLQKLKRYKLRRGEAQEARIWQGFIDYELGRESQALKLWLQVATRDPNHYFGLIATQLLQTYGQLDQRWSSIDEDSKKAMGQKQLLRLYHLAPDQKTKQQVAGKLRQFFPKLREQISYKVLPAKSRARAFAEIGRFDLAGQTLVPAETDTRTAQYLKAKWHLATGAYQRAIIWGEGLLRAYPKWTPYELLPNDIQQFIYPEGFANIVHSKATDFEVDPYLLLAIIREESKFNARAKSVASARGLMQFIPSTANTIASEIESIDDFTLSKLYEPETAITLGARYVDKLMELFEGRSIQTVAAYNAGELTVARWTSYSDDFNPLHFVWDVAYDETKYYCQKVLRAYYHYARVYDQNFTKNLLQPSPILNDINAETEFPQRWEPVESLVTD